VKYKKRDCYKNCCEDICAFFDDKDLNDIFNIPYMISGNTEIRLIKSRIANSNMNKGKSGAYRIYFYVDLRISTIIIIGFYPKSGPHGKPDLSNEELKEHVNQFRNERDSNILTKHNIGNQFIVETAS